MQASGMLYSLAVCLCLAQVGINRGLDKYFTRQHFCDQYYARILREYRPSPTAKTSRHLQRRCKPSLPTPTASHWLTIPSTTLVKMMGPTTPLRIILAAIPLVQRSRFPPKWYHQHEHNLHIFLPLVHLVGSVLDHFLIASSLTNSTHYRMVP